MAVGYEDFLMARLAQHWWNRALDIVPKLPRAVRIKIRPPSE